MIKDLIFEMYETGRSVGSFHMIFGLFIRRYEGDIDGASAIRQDFLDYLSSNTENVDLVDILTAFDSDFPHDADTDPILVKLHLLSKCMDRA